MGEADRICHDLDAIKAEIKVAKWWGRTATGLIAVLLVFVGLVWKDISERTNENEKRVTANSHKISEQEGAAPERRVRLQAIESGLVELKLELKGEIKDLRGDIKQLLRTHPYGYPPEP